MPEAYRMHLRIERLENHQYLATSETVPGLVAQGRTVTETVEIAQDVARKLIESCLDHGDLVDAWAVYDNSGGAPILIGEGERE